MAPFTEALVALNEAGVDYVVVGGLAVVLHGANRLTVDLDLVVSLEPGNARRAISALTNLDLSPRAPVNPIDFADPEKRRAWVEEKGMAVFSMSHSLNPMISVDLFVEPPIEFEGLWDRSIVVEAFGTKVRICSMDDLIAMKKAVGRPQDLLDVESLSKLRDS